MASWVRGKCIGKGAFAVVNVAVSKRDGRVFAVKSVDLKTGLPCQLVALENEIRILKRMSSPHVVAFLGDDVTCEGGKTSSFRNLHLEYMPHGTVADLDHADVDERLVRRLAWCLVDALRHVHAIGVVHCDVKGRNVLIGDGGDGGSVAKLADFGSAVDFNGGECSAPRGSPMWMAPELIRREYQGPESDVWSLGCTVIEMITGKSPWADRGVDTLSQIGYTDELPEFPIGLSELGCDFLRKCLARDWSRRWSCDQLLQHPFLLSNDNSVVDWSPRCVLDWVDSRFTESENACEEEVELGIEENLVKQRIGKLATKSRANWEMEGWVVVRAIESDEEATTENEIEACGEEVGGAIWEFENVVRVEEGMEVGTSLEYSDLGGGVNREIWKFGGRKRSVWQRESDQYNRNMAGTGSAYGWIWRCRYKPVWKKLDRIRGIFSICTLRCKMFKLCYLFSIYYPFQFKILFRSCLQLRYRLIMIMSMFVLNSNGNNFRIIVFEDSYLK